MQAYSEDYLFDAMEALGEAFDCAANRVNLGLDQFFEMFVATGVADAFGAGAPRYVSGSSGIELVLDVCYRAGLDIGVPLTDMASDGEGPDYWCGWVLAYWQWETGRPFRTIGRVTTMEEIRALYWPLHEAAAMKIDQAARSAGVPVLPVGINPGFLMDYRAAVLSGLTGEITHVHIQRIQDASPRRPAFQKKIGAGLTPAEFEAEKLAGRLRHVGLPESVYFLGTALGRKLDAVTETIEPVIAEEDLAIPGAVPVRQGCARGVRQLGLGICDGREFIRMEFVAAIGEPGSTDRVHLCGTPELDSVIRGGVNGDLGTCAIVLNAARAIAAESRSGLLTMLDMPPVTGA